MATHMCKDPARLPAELIDCLRSTNHLCVLTGAGVSAESGVPTFRDAQQGLWARYDPMALASPEGFERDPATVWRWYQWRRELIAGTRPNAGHRALAAMQAWFDRITLVTQNVDGFHAVAGSRGVLELHGNIQRTVCSRTGRVIDEAWLARHSAHHPPPSPHHPQGLARPDVVWFGEALDADILDAAFAAAGACSVMLIAGTSGSVQPAASIPIAAARAGAVLIDVNPQASELTGLARWHLAGASATWLPALLRALETATDGSARPSQRRDEV